MQFHATLTSCASCKGWMTWLLFSPSLPLQGAKIEMLALNGQKEGMRRWGVGYSVSNNLINATAKPRTNSNSERFNPSKARAAAGKARAAHSSMNMQFFLPPVLSRAREKKRNLA